MISNNLVLNMNHANYYFLKYCITLFKILIFIINIVMQIHPTIFFLKFVKPQIDVPGVKFVLHFQQTLLLCCIGTRTGVKVGYKDLDLAKP